MSRAGDKKEEEEKYCQENFDSNIKQEQNWGLIIGIIVGILLLGIGIGSVLWNSHQKKELDKKMEKIVQNMHNFIENSETKHSELQCNFMTPKQAIGNQLPISFERCTCYYDNELNIRACTNNNNSFIENFNRSTIYNGKDNSITYRK